VKSSPRGYNSQGCRGDHDTGHHGTGGAQREAGQGRAKARPAEEAKRLEGAQAEEEPHN
jgi:hypothetical protein